MAPARPRRLASSLALAVGLALLTLSGSAAADLGPPPSCPAGQTSRYLYGHYCGPISCERDDQCGGAKCEERSLCVHDRGGGESRAWEQTGECPTGDCPAESQCVRERFCGAPPARAPEPAVDPTPAMRPTSRGCGCDTTSLRGGAPAWSLCAAGLALAVLGWRRARRR